MSQSDSDFRSDLVELLAGNALGDLDAGELRMLERQWTDENALVAEELQLTAGAVQLVFAGRDSQSMPTALRDRIAADASNHLSITGGRGAVSSLASEQRTSTVSRREQLAWLATAASLLFAIALSASKDSAEEMNPVRARADLIANADDSIVIPWTDGTTPFEGAVSGDVVWSNQMQMGFLRFVGMPINDQSSQQYQLWIVDPRRDDKPIDGGVFDITGDGEVIIPIDAKLTVIDPAAFAVTIEKPGGVVVSDQSRLPLLARVPSENG